MQSDLESLLDRTRAALRAGNLAALPALAEETRIALEALPRDPARLAGLAARAARNAACLEAAAAGLRAARTRLTEIGTLRRSIGYDGKGRRVDVPAPSGVVRRI
ncbi:MAG: hypothetical protein QM656_02700 [Paracoccaceae bacterium]